MPPPPGNAKAKLIIIIIITLSLVRVPYFFPDKCFCLKFVIALRNNGLGIKITIIAREELKIVLP